MRATASPQRQLHFQVGRARNTAPPAVHDALQVCPRHSGIPWGLQGLVYLTRLLRQVLCPWVGTGQAGLSATHLALIVKVSTSLSLFPSR